MSATLFIHLFFIGIWLGCVMVEAVIEIATYRNPNLKSTVALLHAAIDRWVEIPVFTIVLLSGIALLFNATITGLLLLKVSLGLLAIGINLICVRSVFKRKQAADINDHIALDRRHREIAWEFALGVPAGLAAFVIGLRLLGMI